MACQFHEAGLINKCHRRVGSLLARDRLWRSLLLRPHRLINLINRWGCSLGLWRGAKRSQRHRLAALLTQWSPCQCMLRTVSSHAHGSPKAHCSDGQQQGRHITRANRIDPLNSHDMTFATILAGHLHGSSRRGLRGRECQSLGVWIPMVP